DRLQRDGFWLIDAVDYPVNKRGSTPRRRALEESVPRLVERCRKLKPDRGVIICHSGVYAAVASVLRGEGVTVLHDEPLPFPLGNWRARFVEGFRRALGGLERPLTNEASGARTRGVCRRVGRR